MSVIKNEVITKLRTDIKFKLDQIGAFVDNELADYIMVLVANQKTKYQMKDDLSLFLGAETDQFVNWLHNTLKQIQINANQNEDKRVLSSEEKESKDLPKLIDLNTNKSKTKHKRKTNTSEKNENIRESTESVSKGSEELILNVVTPQLTTATNNKIEEKDKTEKLEQNDGEVVLRLNADNEEVDELLQESDVNEEQKNAETKDSKNGNSNSSHSTKPPNRQPLTPSSTIGAVVRNKPKIVEEEDDEEVVRPLVSSVASVVRVTQRKPSVPLELQANKKLLLRAVKDAHDSTAPNRKRANEEPEYTPTPIKRRLGEKQEITTAKAVTKEQVVEEEEQELDPKDLRNYLNVNKKDLKPVEGTEESMTNSRVVKPIQEINPQFVVTLDGVDHNKYMNSTDIEDHLLLDEEVDDEFMETEDNGADEDLENSDLGANQVTEKCRYWPSCKNGDECEFAHPTTPCKTFPNCRFGDRCLYVHPNCKFDTMCSRRDCPFTHTNRRLMPIPSAITSNLLPPSSAKQCKYAPNCKNPACPYFHPKICHFGHKCRSHNCPFIHPNYSSLPAMPSVPHPHQFKWKARDHISERQFAAKASAEEKGSAD